MADLPIDSFEGCSPTELVGWLRRALSELEQERAEKAELKAALLEQRREIEQLKDEVRRLKKLPPRPPFRPSGMEKATPSAEAAAKTEGTPPRRRGPGVSKLRIDREETLKASAPKGSRRKGYEDIVVQDVQFGPFTTLYRRERWETPDGRMIVAELPPGVIGGCGPHLHRLVLMLHFQGQMSCERIVTLLNAVGVAISKRQVVRLLSARLETFQAEEYAVFEAGLPRTPGDQLRPNIACRIDAAKYDEWQLPIEVAMLARHEVPRAGRLPPCARRRQTTLGYNHAAVRRLPALAPIKRGADRSSQPTGLDHAANPAICQILPTPRRERAVLCARRAARPATFRRGRPPLS